MRIVLTITRTMQVFIGRAIGFHVEKAFRYQAAHAVMAAYGKAYSGENQDTTQAQRKYGFQHFHNAKIRM